VPQAYLKGGDGGRFGQNRRDQQSQPQPQRDNGDDGMHGVRSGFQYGQEDHTERIRPKDIREFNGEGVEFFIKNLEVVARIYGERAVCSVIPKCMKGATRDCLTSMDYGDIRYM